MAHPVKRAVCFWCHAPIRWSTWHYYWLGVGNDTSCPDGRLHLAQEIEAAS
jgi:hypothetical protein